MSEAHPETHREVERKLRVHGLYRMPDLAGVAGSGVAEARLRPGFAQTATYYDTGDLRLARSRVTLRRRTGGVDDGWHLKLPGDLLAEGDTDGQGGAAVRDEIRMPLDDSDVPPRGLLDLVTGFTRGVEVEPVAVLVTERVPYDLHDADGTLLAELVDDSVSVLDGPQVVARFRELEVESRDGTPDQVEAVVEALVGSGAVEGGLPSKAVRALGPAASAPADLVEPGPVGPDDPAGAVVRAHLATHALAFVRQDVRVRLRLPDAVHQMRVAARRLRSGLKVFGPLVDPVWAKGLRDELAWIASELGGLRDHEVLEARLLRDLDRLPAARPGDTSDGTAGVDVTDVRDVAAAAAVVRRDFDADHERAQAELTDAMTSERYLALLDALVAAVRRPQLTEAADVRAGEALPPLLAKTFSRLARDVRHLDMDGPDATWHETRIAAKRARYAAEALVPVFGKRAKHAARSLEAVTELLGEHQDAVLAADTCRRLAGVRRVTGTTGFVLGLLHEFERAAVTRARHGLVELWPEVDAERHRSWLRDG